MDQIGRYRIQRELGRGAMGIVYLALDPAIGRTVAIKTIRLSELADPKERTKLRDRLFREAQSAGILSHPNIVTIYDISEQDGVAYIAMECVDGPTLDRMLATSPPDGNLILSVISQTATALDYAHKRGIVHRDIKPANIIIHDGSVAKITDFGVAKIQSHEMTHAGSMVGTPNYMSPEQIQGDPVDGRSDQYSLAVIAYELLTGEKPFAAESIAALAFKIVHDQPEPVHRLNPTLGWTVDTVIRKALSKNADERYPTCTDFAFALENACRACKEWRPMPPGAAHDAATLVDERPVPAAPAAVAVAAAPPPSEEMPARPRPAPVRQKPPVALRIARILATVIVAAAAVSALFVGAYRYFGSEPERETQAVQEEPQPAVRKPSPVGGQPAPPPPEAPAAPAEQQPQAAEAEEPKPRPGAQHVATKLITNPPGAYVVVDGLSEQSCTSPCTLTLPPGRHTLAASREGYRRTLKIFELPRDTENFLNLDATTGTIVIRSEPRGASIVVNGQQRSEKTPAMFTLPTGQYTIEVVRDGQRDRHDVTIRESAITNIAVTFENQ